MELIIPPQSPKSGEKLCATCAIIKPATGFYFHRDSTSPDGWCPVCKECRAKHRQAQRDKEVAKQVKTLQAKLLKSIANGEGRPPLMDMKSSAEILLQMFGGMEGMAEKMLVDYEASGAGTASRTKLLLGALQFVQQAMKESPSVAMEDMSDEDLERALSKVIGHECRRDSEESEGESTLDEPEQD